MMVSMEPRMLSNENEVEEGLSNHLGGGEGGEEDDGDWLENAADLHSFTKVKSQPTLTARPGWFSSTAGDPTYICKGAKSAIFRPSSKFTPFLQTILKPRNGVSRVLQHLVRKTDQKSIHTQARRRVCDGGKRANAALMDPWITQNLFLPHFFIVNR
ncbi:uncharacterized protein LOC112161763 isoform X2 [Oryzias melastigma]|uniref:uncharacterized protein LOC112161763 isoform X2 n=1 Tax=Oryzias melastigma TaxID=30732 RepID=UPI00168D9AA8|nr:uncharacterized protein LOC112161763 isoform X2 [Oryzias melastigma]